MLINLKIRLFFFNVGNSFLERLNKSTRFFSVVFETPHFLCIVIDNTEMSIP